MQFTSLLAFTTIQLVLLLVWNVSTQGIPKLNSTDPSTDLDDHLLHHESRAIRPSKKALYRSGLLHGGATSKPFDDSVDLDLSPTQACIGVELFWYDEYLFALRFIYKGQDRSASPIFHGDSSERDPPLKTGKFMLSAGEKINKVTWYAGTHDWKYNNKLIRFVLGIQFETTNGRISPLYGSNDGDEHSESFKGYTFGYAKGTSVTLIDQLQIVWIKEDAQSSVDE